MKSLVFALLAFAHADLGILSLKDIVAAQENRDGSYDVICANGNRETVSAVDLRLDNVCPNEKGSTPTGVLSLQRRADGQFDVVCRDLTRVIASAAQILANEVCSNSAPNVVIEDGVYAASSTSDCTIKAVYEGSTLVMLKASFPGTTGDLACVDKVCTGRFEGYQQLYRFEILSPTSFEYSYDDHRDPTVFTKR